MTRKLTLRAAWLLLARKWDKPEPDGVEDGNEDLCVFLLEEWPDWGICMCIDTLESRGMIDEAVAAQMRGAELPAKLRGGYCWPRDDAGARARAAFCRKQAKKLAPKRRKARKP